MLFPETFSDVKVALLEHMPFLKMPCMHELLVKKARSLTYFAILSADDDNWDTKAEKWEKVNMYVSFEEDLLQAPEEVKCAEEIRIYENEQFVNSMIEQEALSLIPRKTKFSNFK